MQVQNLKTLATVQYSNINNINYSTVQYSNQDCINIFKNLSDVIPNDGYYPFYLSKIKALGKERFIDLANMARAGSDTPSRLFCWMLKNNESVK